MVRKDVNPQFLSMIVTESGANTFTQVEYAVPVIHDLGNGKALVMELLKVYFNMPTADLVDATATKISCQITRQTKTDIGNLSDPDIIAMQSRDTVCIDTAATDGTVVAGFPENVSVQDLTDGAGNGLLFGSSKIYIAAKGSNNSGAKGVSAKLLYRLKEVSAQELLGIIAE